MPPGSFWRKIPKGWSYKFMMELWVLPSHSSTHDTSQSRQGLARVVTCRETQPWPLHLFKDLLGLPCSMSAWAGRKTSRPYLLAWQVPGQQRSFDSVWIFFFDRPVARRTFPGLSCTRGSCLLYHVTGRELWAQGWQKAQPNLESKHTSQNGGMWIYSLMSFSSSNFKWCSNLDCYK